MQVALIDPLPRDDLSRELHAQPPLERWRGLELYDVLGDDCPALLHEVGRLREQAFRAVGAGRGGAFDLDALDFGALGYRQLVAWDPQHREVVAAIRYQLGARAAEHPDLVLRTASLFHYSKRFEGEILPCAVELGRSVVNHGARRSSLGLFALWRGLAQTARTQPGLGYFFGNVSIYAEYARAAKARLVALVEALYAPKEPLLIARPDLRYIAPPELASDAHTAGQEPGERIRFLRSAVAAHGERLPPILLSYLGLTSALWCGQTALDADFGDALELGIIVPLARIEPSIRARFGLD